MSTTSQQQQPQHGRRRVFNNLDNHRHRDPNNVHRRGERHRREVPDDSNEHNNNVRNEEIDYDVIEPRPETIRPTPDQFRAATKTSTKWTTQFDFFVFY